MLLTKDQAKELGSQMFDSLGDELLEKVDFLFKLLEDDDWSFIIKSHSLIEALVTELIVSKISANELKDVIQRMPLHGDVVSKIKILKVYELLSPEEIKLIIKLSEIRNNIVHNYENINFTFEDFFEKLDKNTKKNWKEILKSEYFENEKFEKLFIEQPKFIVWIVLFRLVGHSLELIHTLKMSKKLTDAAFETTSNMFKKETND